MIFAVRVINASGFLAGVIGAEGRAVVVRLSLFAGAGGFGKEIAVVVLTVGLDAGLVVGAEAGGLVGTDAGGNVVTGAEAGLALGALVADSPVGGEVTLEGVGVAAVGARSTRDRLKTGNGTVFAVIAVEATAVGLRAGAVGDRVAADGTGIDDAGFDTIVGTFTTVVEIANLYTGSERFGVGGGETDCFCRKGLIRPVADAGVTLGIEVTGEAVGDFVAAVGGGVATVGAKGAGSRGGAGGGAVFFVVTILAATPGGGKGTWVLNIIAAACTGGDETGGVAGIGTGAANIGVAGLVAGGELGGGGTADFGGAEELASGRVIDADIGFALVVGGAGVAVGELASIFKPVGFAVVTDPVAKLIVPDLAVLVDGTAIVTRQRFDSATVPGFDSVGPVASVEAVATGVGGTSLGAGAKGRYGVITPAGIVGLGGDF